MKGDVGYFRIDYFDGHASESEPVCDAVMNLMANSRAIILDLRHNGGGNSRVLPLFLGYFIGPDPVHFATRTERWNGTATKLLTRADMKGARHTGKPLIILTSGLTYSLAEQVTYSLRAFRHATIVGERTYGGGNGWDPVVLDDDFYLRIPRIAFTNTLTGTMFKESVGIAPDIPVNAADAKAVGYREALKTLDKAGGTDEERARVCWALDAITAETTNADEHVAYTDTLPDLGRFGDFAFRGSTDRLWLSFRGLPYVRLAEVAPGRYLDNRSIPRLLYFTEPVDSADSLHVVRYGAVEREIPRATPN